MSWPGIYVVWITLYFMPLALTSCVLAGLFGQLAYSRLALPVCTVLFGVATPLVFLGFTFISISIQRDSVWENFGTPEGIENAVFLFLLFGTIGAVLYWSGFREIKKRQINDA